jgi:hypothetical protein
MFPSVHGVPTYFLMWGIAALVCTALGAWVASRFGFPSGRSFLALVLLVIPILLGSKLLYLLEVTFFQKTIASAPLDEFFPAITVDENHFARVVYLRRVDHETNRFNVYSTYSGDAGSNWNGPTQVNDGGNISPVLPIDDDFIGDYIGIDAKFERHPGWMDTRGAPPLTPYFDAYSAVMFGC